MIATRTLAEMILRNAKSYDWTLQGMGMLRLHLPNHCRLHVWDKRFRVPNVSMIHDHMQWGLESTVLAGRLINKKYEAYTEESYFQKGGADYLYTVLKPGEGCYFKDDVRPIKLLEDVFEVVREGQSYKQHPLEIHETDALDGTVTFMQKFPTNDESARVFWPEGTEWVSAEPRKASPDEVHAIVSLSLERWFK